MLWVKRFLKRIRYPFGDPLNPKFELVDCDGGFLSAVLIKRGKFKGVRFLIGNVRPSPTGSLSFTTDVLDNPRNADIESDLFTKISGNILVRLIKKQRKENAPALIRKG